MKVSKSASIEEKNHSWDLYLTVSIHNALYTVVLRYRVG